VVPEETPLFNTDGTDYGTDYADSAPECTKRPSKKSQSPTKKAPSPPEQIDPVQHPKPPPDIRVIRATIHSIRVNQQPQRPSQ
jgi:hypothetical protein